MRKMASVRSIAEVKPIPDADRIEAVRVDGWWVVVGKGEFKDGDMVVYLEVDSWVPSWLAPQSLAKDGKWKVYEGVEGARLRTVKLRGQLSQGLVLPLSVLQTNDEEIGDDWYYQGEDVSDVLGVLKWEAPDDAPKHADAKGKFPAFIPKTDQERVQNLVSYLPQYVGKTFEVTVKLDGQSMTVYKHNGQIGVCSRNLELKEGDNPLWNIARKLALFDKIPDGVALQGEYLSPKVQGNYEKVAEPQWFCYNVYSIGQQKYLSPENARRYCASADIPYVPVFNPCFQLFEDTGVETLLEMAEGDGMNPGVMREGLVFKLNSEEEQFSFKAISNSYLLKSKK